MKDFEISVQRFDQFAAEYAQRFMDLSAYMDSIGHFCNLVGKSQPAILKLACAPGNVTRIRKQRFPESQITAIDLAPNMLEIARKQLPDVDFRLMDVRNVSAIPEKFDAIMCSFCLPFLSKADAKQLIADSFDRLTFEGVVYISTMEGTMDQAGFEATSFSGNSKVYFNYHLKHDLEAALKNIGFEIRQIKLQDYFEPNGLVFKDMIFIGVKKN